MRLSHAFLIGMFMLPCWCLAQTNPPAPSNPAPPSPPINQTVGPTAFVQIQGSSTSLGLVTTLDANVGYQLGSHLGVDIGVPIFFVRSPFSLVTNKDWEWTHLLGEPYIDVHYTKDFSGASVTSVLTGAIPVQGSTKIFSTGRFGVDWFNHVQSRTPSKASRPFLTWELRMRRSTDFTCPGLTARPVHTKPWA